MYLAVLAKRAAVFESCALLALSRPRYAFLFYVGETPDISCIDITEVIELVNCDGVNGHHARPPIALRREAQQGLLPKLTFVVGCVFRGDEPKTPRPLLNISLA